MTDAPKTIAYGTVDNLRAAADRLDEITIRDAVTHQPVRTLEAPRLVGIHAQPAQENPMPDTSPTDQQPGDLARGVLKDQLDDARQELADDLNIQDIYREQVAASQARVDALEAAIADLDQAAHPAAPGSLAYAQQQAERNGDLEHETEEETR